jgi:Tol biopolymer transport system component/DNA-binding winged helix-turn-helix (wHTH) protein
MATSHSSPVSARFDQFEVDLSSRELRKWGVRVPVQEQPFLLLRLLLEAEGKVIHREQLRDALWPADTFVDFEHGVNTAIRKLRVALGDSPDHPKFIETLPKQGYRFMAPVEWMPQADGMEEQPIKVPAVPSASEPDPFSTEPPKRRWKRPAAFAVIGFAVLSIVWLVGMTLGKPEPTLTAVPLTALPGTAPWSSFSPDGQQVSFAWDRGLGSRRSELFIQSVGGSGPPLQLTHTTAPAVLGSWLTAWTPDGKWITYVRYDPKPAQKPIEIVLTPTPVGGPEVVLLRTYPADCGLSWSPDGKYLVFSDRDLPQEPYALFLLQRDTLERRRLTSPPAGTVGGDGFAVFSHDGKKVAFVRDLGGMRQLAVLTMPSGNIQILPSGPGRIFSSLAWAPEDADIIYASEVGGSSRLWRIAVGGGKPRPLGIGEDGWAPTVSKEGHRLAYGKGSSDSNIWRIHFGKDSLETRAPLIASSRQDLEPQFSPDESKIAFTSDRSGSAEIWMSDGDGNNPRQITQIEDSSTSWPRWSPDGKQIAFDSRVRGKSGVYLVGLQGAKPRFVTDDGVGAKWPNWSADGNWIYYQSHRSGEMQIWKVPAQGGQAIQVTKHGGDFAFEDGHDLYYVIANNSSELWRRNLRNGDEHRVAEVTDIPDSMSFQIMNDGIYFTIPDSSGSDIHSSLRYFSFVTRKMRTVTPLGNMMWTHGISISRDGRTILYSQQDHLNQNIMLVENFH